MAFSLARARRHSYGIREGATEVPQGKSHTMNVQLLAQFGWAKGAHLLITNGLHRSGHGIQIAAFLVGSGVPQTAPEGLQL